ILGPLEGPLPDLHVDASRQHSDIPLGGFTRGRCEGRESRAYCRNPWARFRQSDRDRLRPQAGRSGHCESTRLNRSRTTSPNCSGNIAGGHQVKRPQKMILVEDPRQAAWLEILLAVAVLLVSGWAVGPEYDPPVVQARRA